MKINITEVPVTISTCPGEVWLKRLRSVQQMLKDLKFKKVKLLMGEIAKPYVFGTNENAIKIFTLNKVPFIYMEDDAALMKENYYEELDIPDECDILFLGGATHANSHFVTRELGVLRNKAHGTASGTLAYKIINKDFVRIYNMFCSHAILFLTERGRTSFLTTIERFRNLPLDVAFSFEMPNLNVYMVRHPFFFQNDGHNDVYTKQVIYDQEGKTIIVDKEQFKSKQHPLETIRRININGRDPVIIRTGVF